MFYLKGKMIEIGKVNCVVVLGILNSVDFSNFVARVGQVVGGAGTMESRFGIESHRGIR